MAANVLLSKWAEENEKEQERDPLLGFHCNRAGDQMEFWINILFCTDGEIQPVKELKRLQPCRRCCKGRGRKLRWSLRILQWNMNICTKCQRGDPLNICCDQSRGSADVDLHTYRPSTMMDPATTSVMWKTWQITPNSSRCEVSTLSAQHPQSSHLLIPRLIIYDKSKCRERCSLCVILLYL